MKPQITLLLALAVGGAAQAQTAAALFQAAITRDGRACPSVTDAAPIGTTESGDALIAVACADGGRHVLRITGSDRVEYFSTCRTLELTTEAKCFAE